MAWTYTLRSPSAPTTPIMKQIKRVTFPSEFFAFTVLKILTSKLVYLQMVSRGLKFWTRNPLVWEGRREGRFLMLWNLRVSLPLLSEGARHAPVASANGRAVLLSRRFRDVIIRVSLDFRLQRRDVAGGSEQAWVTAALQHGATCGLIYLAA